MRRSPSEYYIRYRIIRDRTATDKDIESELNNELVFLPNKDYLGNLRDEIVFPPDFRPMDLSHVISQAFLRTHKVWSMFHPLRGTREALNAFKELQARTLLQTLISGPSPDPVIRDVFEKRTGMPLSESGLDEFKHYFWNLKLVTLQELAEYVRVFLGDKTILDVLRLPRTKEGVMVGLARIGILPREIDEEEVYRTFANEFYMDFLALSMTLPPGLQRTTAFKMAQEGRMMADDRLKAIASRRGDILEQVAAVQARMLDIKGTTLIDLKQGKSPEPLGLLPAEDEEVNNGSKTGS